MFVGRERELKSLRDTVGIGNATLIVVTGRHRIGKSTLIREFGKSFQEYHEFSALAPESGIGPKQQKLEFARQLASEFELPKFKSNDWAELFLLLSKQVFA